MEGKRARTRVVLGVLGIIAVIATAIGLSVVAGRLPPASPHEDFGSLYLAGTSAKVQQPIPYTPGDRLHITVGLANHAAEARTYALTLSILSKTFPQGTVRLPPGRNWQGTLSGVAPAKGCLERLTITARGVERGAPTTPREELRIGVWLQPRGEGHDCLNDPVTTETPS